MPDVRGDADPRDTDSDRCYITGLRGMFRHHGEPDVRFADGTTGDGFSFRWRPARGGPAASTTA